MPNNLDALTFSEADKSSHAAFDKDAAGIIWSVKNREARPERFGNSRDEVIFAPGQYTGVGGDEWNKVVNNKLTEDEEWYVKRAAQLRKAIDDGKIEDPTGGADHYYNPKLASPAFGKLKNKESVDMYENYYPETYQTSGHSYRKETLRKPEKKKSIVVKKVEQKDKLTFDRAFGKARKAGKKTFTWDGGKYTTKMK